MASVYQDLFPVAEDESSSLYQRFTSQLEFPREWLHRRRKIGQGEFADVYVATVNGTAWRMLEDKRVAVKVLKGTIFFP